MTDRHEDLARDAFSGFGSLLFWIFFAAWHLGWLAIAGFGLLTDVHRITVLGLSIALMSSMSWLSARTIRRLLLHRQARTSLVSRARLERVSLNRGAEAVLGAFDHSYQRALGLLAAPELESLAEQARRNVDRIRTRIYDVVALEMRLRRDAKNLRRLHRVSAVDSALGELGQQMRSLHDESDKMALDAQRIVDRLDRVRRLASSETPAESREAVTRVLADLDATATAYEEIERERVAGGERGAQGVRGRAVRQSQQ